jgi:5-methylcytosine-specific restriction protein A
LFCERCCADPIEIFGSEHGEACIEVHHARVQVGQMPEDHTTRLEDLQCLCANCHRFVHRLLRRGLPIQEQ